nr:thioredoxin family protein [Polyangiaceae bacterium]
MLRTFLAMAALAAPLHAAPLWLEDYDAALKTASTTGKYVLVDVTGSDWCPPCQQMEAEVFSRPGFSAAAERYVLLRLDYPRTIAQSEKIKAQNKKLAQRYPFDGVPTYFMLDGKGDAFGKYTGYLPGGVTAFLSLARNFETQKDVLDKLAVTVLNAAPGVDRARAQDALYRQAEDWELQWRYADL